MLIAGAAVWMHVDALGLPRDHPQLPAVVGGRFERQRALGQLVERLGTDVLIPVDGLISGGPVFEVREFLLDSNLPNVPSR